MTCTTIGFPPYSEKQLRDIITSKARAAGFSKHRCRSSDLLVSKSAVSASDGTSAPASSEMPTTVETVYAAGSDRHDYSTDLDAFSGIMLVALPQLLAKTRHVGDLWEMCMTLWGYMFHSSAFSASEYIRATDFHDPSRPLPTPGGDSSNVGAVPSRVSERFHIDFKAVKAATQQMLLMPATHVLKVQGPSRTKTKSRSASNSQVQHIEISRLDSMDAVTENRTSTATASSERRSVASGAQKRSLLCDLLQAAPEDVNHFIDANLRKCAVPCMSLQLLAD